MTNKENEIVNHLTRTLATGICLLGFAAMAPTSGYAADAAAGKTLYDTKCKTCHLADGSGNKGMAKALSADIKPLGSPEVQKLSDDDIKKTITAGSGKMKPVAGIAGADLENVVAYVRSLKK